MTQRLTPADRTRSLLDIAVRLAAADGWRTITREAIAVAAGVSPALVSQRLGTAAAIRRAVMRAAVTQRVVRVVAEGLAVDDPHARKADRALRDLCAEWVRK
jgi:AcrR family transcriptional regulator